jgi:hypothetical protein
MRLLSASTVRVESLSHPNVSQLLPCLPMYLTVRQQHTISVGIRGGFDPLFRELYLTTYISVVSLGPPNEVDTGSPCIVENKQVQ